MAAHWARVVANTKSRLRQVQAGISQAGSRSWGQVSIQRIFFFHSRAWKSMGDPIVGILSDPEPDQRDTLTRRWREQMTLQLNVILVTSALTASLVAGSFSWPDFSPSSPPGKVLILVKALWFSSLLFSVFSIASAAQLSIALSRIATYSADLPYTRRMLTKARPPGVFESSHLSYPKLYLWQIPAMLLNGSIYLYVMGLVILVYKLSWDLASLKLGVEAIEIIVIFSLALVWVVSNYILSSAGLYYWIGQACEV